MVSLRSASFLTPSHEALFADLMNKTLNFRISKKLNSSSNLYDLNYYKMRLNLLEAFDEGSCLLANRIKLERYFLPITTPGMDSHACEYITRVTDVTVAQLRGTLCFLHGEEMCSNVFIEMALTMALNGFAVLLIDLECYGYSSGHRINDICVEKFHHNIKTLLHEADPGLPCYLVGHGVGSLAICNFLALNKHVSDKLAGVIYLTPMFGRKNEPNFLQ